MHGQVAGCHLQLLPNSLADVVRWAATSLRLEASNDIAAYLLDRGHVGLG